MAGVAVAAKEIYKELKTDQPAWKKAAKSCARIYVAFSYCFLDDILGFSVLAISILAPCLLDDVQKKTSEN